GLLRAGRSCAAAGRCVVWEGLRELCCAMWRQWRLIAGHGGRGEAVRRAPPAQEGGCPGRIHAGRNQSCQGHRVIRDSGCWPCRSGAASQAGSPRLCRGAGRLRNAQP
ncbi:unnamed protein product, partial [Symbiodinium necroappetens]